MKSALATSLALLAGAASAGQPRAAVPVAFQGDWQLASRPCPTDLPDDGSMRIAAEEVRTFESRGTVTAVETIDDRTIKLSTRMRHGAGTFGSIETISLSKDGQRLTIGEHSDMSIYRRCLQ